MKKIDIESVKCPSCGLPSDGLCITCRLQPKAVDAVTLSGLDNDRTPARVFVALGILAAICFLVAILSACGDSTQPISGKPGDVTCYSAGIIVLDIKNAESVQRGSYGLNYTKDGVAYNTTTGMECVVRYK